MSNSLASVKLLEGDFGKISADQVRAAVNPDDVHAPETTLVSLENTMNKGGGSIYTLDEIKPIRKVCDVHDLKLHLDGARLFNALAETGESPAKWGAQFDTVSICLSKGLGCPVGSLLLGSKSDIRRARKVRKVWGGGMRQAGFLAAAGIYALNNHVTRLKEDHARARALGAMLLKLSFVPEVYPVTTNIVIARLQGVSPEDFMKKLEDQKIKSVKFGTDLVRFVTHLDFDDEQLEEFGKRISKILFL